MPSRLGPRFAIEALFLVAVAVAVGVADLSAEGIVVVMAGAWLLTAAVEWAASTRDRWSVQRPRMAWPGQQAPEPVAAVPVPVDSWEETAVPAAPVVVSEPEPLPEDMLAPTPPAPPPPPPVEEKEEVPPAAVEETAQPPAVEEPAAEAPAEPEAETGIEPGAAAVAAAGAAASAAARADDEQRAKYALTPLEPRAKKTRFFWLRALKTGGRAGGRHRASAAGPSPSRRPNLRPSPG